MAGSQSDEPLITDSGHKYQAKLFNPEWLKRKGLESELPVVSVSG
ncbi:hypothetical protein HNQ64_000056 [Prosthecobacter dejongeii]|uniref:Uncharacterized protein n=1 Tax=Prosthecobacter dejongeii TaxID=48465 RepID=A0A7W8DN03_9BACT|nr:hypothetical protein [Prosthecobacter dejongeii]